ncbi:MAG: PHP domain-containing protein [Geodermatophilaceae bacterium]|nr:PHP domain-containing protein [Geodermatophilaceae bacterium]
MRIDLHTHSARSDGTDTPAQLMAAAIAAGLDVIALTDHDTTAGWSEVAAHRPSGLIVVPGVELSCASPVAGAHAIGVHLLGYLFDREHPAFRAERVRLRASRFGRAEEMVRRMRAAGLPIEWEQVQEIAAGAPVGRPHMALALVRSGLARTVDEAFSEHLNHGNPYYVRKADVDVRDGVRLIRAAGGVPVLAHPLARRRGRVVGDDVIAGLATAGLFGLEVDHPDHLDEDRRHLRVLAHELGLFCTGSSDYHGRNKPTPIGMCATDPGVLDAIVGLATGTPPYAD